MTSNILYILITFVNSELASDTSSMVIDNYRAFLELETIQVLLYNENWFYHLYSIKEKKRELIIYFHNLLPIILYLTYDIFILFTRKMRSTIYLRHFHTLWFYMVCFY